MLCESGGAIEVADAEALFHQVVRLLQKTEEAELIGQRAYQALQANRGALAAVVDDIACTLRRHA
jgi:hypothetical protein